MQSTILQETIAKDLLQIGAVFLRPDQPFTCLLYTSLVDFGDDPRLLELYKTLCRHIYYKHLALVTGHIALFRLQFEETEDEEHHGY